MLQYYAAIIRATRSSARALTKAQNLARQIRDAKDPERRVALIVQREHAIAAYARAQEILARHPLSFADIAARQADYPKARE